MAGALAILVAASLRIVGICGAAWLATLALRRSSAAARHVVWVNAIAAALLMPALLALPTPLPLPAFVSWTPRPAATFRVGPAISDLVPMVEQLAMPASARAPQEAPRPRRMSFTSAAALWATGTGLVLLWVLHGVLTTSRMRRRGA